jgi:predicted nucleic acid-binding protein
MSKMIVTADEFKINIDKYLSLADREEILITKNGKLVGFVTASAATDIYYILRKSVGREKALKSLKLIVSVLEVADVGKNDILRAMEADMKDFEDALAAVCAKRVKTEYIVTRNMNDFLKSPVPAATPEKIASMI